jgi:CrcB protein
LRHGVNVAAARLVGFGFPWGTLSVNILGSFAMGVLAGWLALKAGEEWTQPVRVFVATGILGGFTTFSAFSLDAVLLWERGQIALAAAYIVASVVLSIGGLVGGLALVRIAT